VLGGLRRRIAPARSREVCRRLWLAVPGSTSVAYLSVPGKNTAAFAAPFGYRRRGRTGGGSPEPTIPGKADWVVGNLWRRNPVGVRRRAERRGALARPVYTAVAWESAAGSAVASSSRTAERNRAIAGRGDWLGGFAAGGRPPSVLGAGHAGTVFRRIGDRQ